MLGVGDDEEDGPGRRRPAALVAEVRRSLLAHVPGDGREARAKREVLAALGSLERPFDEQAQPRHVTGSAVLVGRRGTVLHLHKRLRRWLQPGGHVEPGESPWEAALRESREETGLLLSHPQRGPSLVHVDVHEAAKGHEHLDLRYLLVAADMEPSPPLGESPEVSWFSWEEALKLADEALQGALVVARRQPEASMPPQTDGASTAARAKASGRP
jgi:8-oxo-dGTP pyrophosphatase MutT (NUDIX family)